MRHLFPLLTIISIALISTSCAQYGFDITREPDQRSLQVDTTHDTTLAADPLQYRMRADEGHLILWIENPTNQPIELLGDHSNIIDPDGVQHPLHSQKIAPLSSIKEVLPPVDEPAPGPPPAINPLNPYDQPGFISPPGLGQSDAKESPYSWQWDDESDIRLNLFFLQGQKQFEQHFTIRRVKK